MELLIQKQNHIIDMENSKILEKRLNVTDEYRVYKNAWKNDSF